MSVEFDFVFLLNISDNITLSDGTDIQTIEPNSLVSVYCDAGHPTYLPAQYFYDLLMINGLFFPCRVCETRCLTYDTIHECFEKACESNYQADLKLTQRSDESLADVVCCSIFTTAFVVLWFLFILDVFF